MCAEYVAMVWVALNCSVNTNTSLKNFWMLIDRALVCILVVLWNYFVHHNINWMLYNYISLVISCMYSLLSLLHSTLLMFDGTLTLLDYYDYTNQGLHCMMIEQFLLYGNPITCTITIVPVMKRHKINTSTIVTQLAKNSSFEEPWMQELHLS